MHSRAKIRKFKKTVTDYYRVHGRRLVFRTTKDPYRILVSEIMLQQTQVPRVVPKYRLFVRQFPNFRALARASVREVLAAWSGLGYNRRALYLKRIAERVVREYDGRLPTDPEILKTFPGIGPNTAGSIAAFAFDAPVVFIETNIRRVFLHHFFSDRTHVPDAKLLPIIAEILRLGSGSRGESPREWYYALMDYGSMLGETHRQAEGKLVNPNRRSHHYARQSKFAGSERQVRGQLVRLLLGEEKLTAPVLIRRAGDSRAERVLKRLVLEGFVQKIGATYRLAK